MQYSNHFLKFCHGIRKNSYFPSLPGNDSLGRFFQGNMLGIFYLTRIPVVGNFSLDLAEKTKYLSYSLWVSKAIS
jgi:hypothetical protein